MASVRVFVPTPGSRFARIVRPGSAVVSADGPAAELLRVDFEGGSQASNIATFADRCHHAAGRHLTNYPTAARSLAPLPQLVQIGSYDDESGEVSLDNDDARAALAAWLRTDTLERELLTEGTARHMMRREVIELRTRGDFAQARWLARHYHLDELA
jgi:hypothetical protein